MCMFCTDGGVEKPQPMGGGGELAGAWISCED